MLGVTLFEQIFCAKTKTRQVTHSVFRPPSSRSARVAANRATFYTQLPTKQDNEPQPTSEEARLTSFAEFGDIHQHLKRLEQEVLSIKDMLQDVTREKSSGSKIGM